MTFKINLCILSLAFALITSNVSGYMNDTKSTNDIDNESCENVESLVRALNNFTLDLYKQIISPKGTKDVFFSPISITTALSILLLGAEGNTKYEIRKVLHIAGLSDASIHNSFRCLKQFLHSETAGNIFLSANKLFPSKHLNVKNEFSRYVDRFYSGSIRQLNFSNVGESMNTINKWVAKHTNNMIKDVLHPGDLDALTVMVLVNAVYFEGEWNEKFLANHTKPHSFHSSPEAEAINVTMMYKPGEFKYYDSAELNAELMELPYRKDGKLKLSMILVIPKERYGLAEVEHHLTLETLTHGITHMRMAQKDIFLPRLIFKSRYTLDLILQDLGMKDLFSSQINLSQFSADSGLALSAVLHEAVIKVNEEGTKASAMTFTLTTRTVRSSVTCDHPFLFLIQDTDTGAILFIGRTVDPPEAPQEVIPVGINGNLECDLEKCKRKCRNGCYEEMRLQLLEEDNTLKLNNLKIVKKLFKKNETEKLSKNFAGCKKKCNTLCRRECP